MLYDAPVFRTDSALSGDGRSAKRIDENDLAFFKRDLEQIDKRVYKTLEHDLGFITTFYTNDDIDPGINRYGYQMLKGYGQSIAGAKNASDIPLVHVAAEEFTSYFTNIDVALEYTDQDIAASRVANNDIVGRLRDRALRSNFEFMNKLCFQGSKELKIEGLLNHTHLTNKSKVAKGKTSETWASKTGEEIVNDVIEAYDDSLKATGSQIVPDTLLVSLTSYNLMTSKIFNSNASDNYTVLKHLENSLHCKIKKLPELNNAFTDGANGFVLFKNDRDFVEQLMPIPFRTTEPQQRAWTHTVFCRSRYGGLIIRQPKMFAIRYGI